MLGALSLVYDSVVQHSAVGTMLLLVVIGFCIYGPQVLLVGTAPADLAHRGTSAAAAGFVNFMGYMGAATGDVVTGYYSSPDHGGWQVAIYIWAGWAFAGAVIMAMLWNTTSRQVGVLPGIVPEAGGDRDAVASPASRSAYGQQPLALATWPRMPAAVCLLATVCQSLGGGAGIGRGGGRTADGLCRRTCERGERVTWQQSDGHGGLRTDDDHGR